MKKAPFFLGVAWLVAQQAASAQEPAYAEFVERTNASAPPPTVDAVAPLALGRLREVAQQTNACVPTSIRLDAPQTAIATAVITQGVLAGQIKNGWTVYGRVEGCPNSAPIRFMVIRMADDNLRVLVVNEGETLANPGLMRDTSASAAVAALGVLRGADPSCTGADLQMGPTRVTERGANLGPNFHGAYFSGSWKETWTFAACGRRAEVPVEFTADGQGGANFNVRGTEARLTE